jgi:hypothetical protein
MHMAATYFNIGHVEKIEVTTSKRAPKKALIPKQNAPPKPSCGSLEISTPTKKKETLAQPELQFKNNKNFKNA